MADRVVSLCRVDVRCACVRLCRMRHLVPRYSIRYMYSLYKLHNNIRFCVSLCAAFSGLGSTGCTSCLSLDVCFLFSFVTLFLDLCAHFIFNDATDRDRWLDQFWKLAPKRVALAVRLFDLYGRCVCVLIQSRCEYVVYCATHSARPDTFLIRNFIDSLGNTQHRYACASISYGRPIAQRWKR